LEKYRLFLQLFTDPIVQNMPSQAWGGGQSPLFWHPSQLCSSALISSFHFCVHERSESYIQHLLSKSPGLPIHRGPQILSLPEYHYSATRDCVFPPILEKRTQHSAKEKALRSCLAYGPVTRICVFSYSTPPHYRMLSCPRTVSIFLIMQLKTISEWICTRGKELNCTASLEFVIACLFTAWLF